MCCGKSNTSLLSSLCVVRERKGFQIRDLTFYIRKLQPGGERSVKTKSRLKKKKDKEVSVEINEIENSN